jgi:O-antigen ligase
MTSYFLLLYVIQQLVLRLLITEKERFLKGLIAFGTLVLISGIGLKYIMPNIVLFQSTGRFNGLLGNPNGLGIFTFVFFMLYMIIRKYNPEYFTPKENYIILGAIALSLIFAGSRGGIFSSVLFITGYFLFQRSTFLGFTVLISVFVSYQIVAANIEEIITTLGLQEYFRIETLEKGSGRLEAFRFAWEHIQYNYWFGRGFGYTEYLMHKYQDYFISKGHQGNVHNSYLTIWLDTGLVGLTAFIFGWLKNFYKASIYSPLIWAVLFGTLLTTTVESWLAASLNPFTIQLVIIVTLLSRPEFYEKEGKGIKV